MTKSDFTRTVAALFCTVVMSATCVLGAVAPAQAVGEKPVVVTQQVA